MSNHKVARRSLTAQIVLLLALLAAALMACVPAPEGPVTTAAPSITAPTFEPYVLEQSKMFKPPFLATTTVPTENDVRRLLTDALQAPVNPRATHAPVVYGLQVVGSLEPIKIADPFSVCAVFPEATLVELGALGDLVLVRYEQSPKAVGGECPEGAVAFVPATWFVQD